VSLDFEVLDKLLKLSQISVLAQIKERSLDIVILANMINLNYFLEYDELLQIGYMDQLESTSFC